MRIICLNLNMISFATFKQGKIMKISGKQTKFCQVQIKYFGIFNTHLCKRDITRKNTLSNLIIFPFCWTQLWISRIHGKRSSFSLKYFLCDTKSLKSIKSSIKDTKGCFLLILANLSHTSQKGNELSLQYSNAPRR